MLDEFIGSRAGRSAATVADYRHKLAYLVRYAESLGREVGALTLDDLTGYVAWLRGRRLADASLVSICAVARAFVRWAVDRGYMPADLLRWRPGVSWRRDVPRAASADDWDRLYAVAGQRDRLLLLLLRDTGARIGSLVALDVGDVDVARGRILARRTKSGRPQVLYMSKRLASAVAERLAAGGGPLVRSRDGRRLTVSGARQALRRLAARAGVRGRVNPHAWRHAFAREMLQAGCDLARLSRLLGHADVSVTVSSYAVFDGAELQAAYNQFWPAGRDVGVSWLPKDARA